MKYFRNTELAKLYGVSEKSVRNWIQAAQTAKIDLQLYEHNSKWFVANTSKNTAVIEELVAKGKKYKNTRGHKVVQPSQKFYSLYDQTQVLDIISNLEIHKEIPRQYNYFDGGASYWDRFAHRLWKEDTPNLLKCTVELLENNSKILDTLLHNHSRVNIIDLGVGNALPVKGLLSHLVDQGKLNRYIAVDISSEMLEIARQNIHEWFGDKVAYEGHIRDITHERFDDLIVEDMLQKDADQTINLVLLLGGTLMNFRAPYDVLKAIYGSMGHNDLLVYTDKPDTEAERRYFDINAEPESTALSSKYRFILDLMNIDSDLYEVEMGFNEQKLERYIYIRLKLALTIQFDFQGIHRKIEFSKGDKILLWRAWHQTSLDLITNFERTGFALLQSSATTDRQYLLTISGVSSKPSVY